MTLSVLAVDKNIKDITPMGDMKEVLSLVKINDTMVSKAQEISEDKIPEIKNVHEEDRRGPTPSRGGG